MSEECVRKRITSLWVSHASEFQFEREEDRGISARVYDQEDSELREDLTEEDRIYRRMSGVIVVTSKRRWGMSEKGESGRSIGSKNAEWRCAVERGSTISTQLQITTPKQGPITISASRLPLQKFHHILPASPLQTSLTPRRFRRPRFLLCRDLPPPLIPQSPLSRPYNPNSGEPRIPPNHPSLRILR
jgi:hypothetical protein